MILKLCNNGQSVFGEGEDGVFVSYSINAEEYKQWHSEGNEPESEFTEEELQKQEELKASNDRKYLGIDYTNLENEVYKVSLTNDDANGLIQVKTAFEMGISETNFYFENGTVVSLKSIDDLLHLGQFVSIERNKFFL